MKNIIEIERIPYEEPYHLELMFKASTEEHAGQLRIYTKTESLKECAQNLIVFPRHSSDSVLWELGSERPEDRFGFYFRFRAILQKSNGESFIQIRLNNNEAAPGTAISEFYMSTKVESIQILGGLIREFSELESSKLFWNGVDGHVIK